MARVLTNRKMNLVVSHLAEVQAEISETTQVIGAEAHSRLAAHRDTGEASVEIDFGETDGMVYLVDEAALSIEFDRFHNISGKKIGGLHIITGAAGIVK